MLLLGEYDRIIDDKNRLTLPTLFRDEMAGAVIVTRGVPKFGCVFLFTPDRFSRLVGQMDVLDPLREEVLGVQRYFFSGAIEVVPDKQGRITIPRALRKAARIEKYVVIAGVFDHVEVWNDALWREHLKEIENSAAEVAQRLTYAGLEPTAERIAQLLAGLTDDAAWKKQIEEAQAERKELAQWLADSADDRPNRD